MLAWNYDNTPSPSLLARVKKYLLLQDEVKYPYPLQPTQFIIHSSIPWIPLLLTISIQSVTDWASDWQDEI